MLTKVSVSRLHCVPETLLLPLYNRALESKRTDAIVHDERAVEQNPASRENQDRGIHSSADALGHFVANKFHACTVQVRSKLQGVGNAREVGSP
jgi:O-methyltransferase involved in polyketide biosynthesis